MASPNDGQWVFGLPAFNSTVFGFTGFTLGTSLGNGVPFPAAVAGNLNVEVFVAQSGAPPTPDAGFQDAATDDGGNVTVTAGLLTGSVLQLGGGNYILTDSVVGSTHTPGQIILGTGNQTVVGAAGDTLTGSGGGFSGQLLNAIAGTESVVGGTSGYTVFGGVGDTIVGNTGATSSTFGWIYGSRGSMAIQLPSAGNYIVGSGAGDMITAASGAANALIFGAAGDSINMTGNTGNLTLTGTFFSFGRGPDKITAGSGADTLIAGVGDTIVGGVGGTAQLIDAAGGAVIAVGSGGTDVIGGGGFAQSGTDTITALSGNAALNMTAGTKDSINLTGNTGAELITGAANAVVTVGSGASAGVFGAGNMSITLGTAGADVVLGSSVAGAGDTITGTSAATLDYNPGLTSASAIGGGDLINLTGSTGNATINAVSNGTVQGAVNDTVIAGNGPDSVFGGTGDRIGVGKGATVGGSHLWLHSSSATAAGSGMAFGTNDTVNSTTYNTVTGIATRGSAAGTSSASVTVGATVAAGAPSVDFATGTDSLFYQGETSATTASIVATSNSTTIFGVASSILTLPDGTTMTLVGVTTTQLATANAAGTLFTP